MKTIAPCLLAACSLCSLMPAAFSQLSLTSGVDPNASPNGSYAAVQLSSFSNGGAGGSMSTGTGNNLSATLPHGWSQKTYGITFTYAPTPGADGVSVSNGINNGGISKSISIPSTAPSELQVLVANSGLGDLTLTLDSINSVAYGGAQSVSGGYEVFGGSPPSFAAGSTLSAANGESLQAYLDDPTIFSQAFTLHGTITLDTPANTTDYGDGLNSLVEFNLAPVPEPSTGWLIGIGLGALALLRKRASGA